MATNRGGQIELIRTFCNKRNGFDLRYYLFNNITAAVDQGGRPLGVTDNSVIVDPLVTTRFIATNGTSSITINTEACTCIMTTNLVFTLEPLCNGDQGTVVAQVLNGSAPYTFQWTINGVVQQNQSATINFVRINPMEVGVVATDSKGCKSLYNRIGFRPSSNCEQGSETLKRIVSDIYGKDWFQDHQLTPTTIFVSKTRQCEVPQPIPENPYRPKRLDKGWVYRRNENDYFKGVSFTYHQEDKNTIQFGDLMSIDYCTKMVYNPQQYYTGRDIFEQATNWKKNVLLITTTNDFDKTTRYWLYDTTNQLAGLKLIYSIKIGSGKNRWQHNYGNKNEWALAWVGIIRHGNKLYHYCSAAQDEYGNGAYYDIVRVLEIDGDNILNHNSYYLEPSSILGGNDLYYPNFTSTKFGIMKPQNNVGHPFYYATPSINGEYLKFNYQEILNPMNATSSIDNWGSFSINRI